MDWIELGRSMQPWATMGALSVAGGSLFVAAKSLSLTSKTNKAKFVFDLTEAFLKEPSLKSFWYCLDYNKQTSAWKFDLKNFRHSDDERIIDTILYKFNVIGHMIRNGSVSADDVIGLYIVCRQFFHNEEIREYLRFVQLDFYCADGFTYLQFGDALYCYNMMTKVAVKRRFVNKKELRNCNQFIGELKLIPWDDGLRHIISSRIGYKLQVPPMMCFTRWRSLICLVAAVLARKPKIAPPSNLNL